MPARALFIINPAAGGERGRRRWAQFEQRWLSGSVSMPNQEENLASGGTRLMRENPRATAEIQVRPGLPVEKVFTSRPGEAAEIARKAAGQYDILVAVGGDGTVGEVANGILSATDMRARLGIVPCGTGNDIAANAGLGNIHSARAALIAGRYQPMDVIKIECRGADYLHRRHALLFGGVGVIAPLLRSATPLAKRLLGRGFAYRVGLLCSLWSYEPARMAVRCDGQSFEGRFLFLGASNAETAGGGIKIAPGSRTDDGILNVNLVGEIGFLDGLAHFRRLCQGRHTCHPQVRFFEARNISVEAEETVEVAADGELIGHTPARFEVQPGALSVLVKP